MRRPRTRFAARAAAKTAANPASSRLSRKRIISRIPPTMHSRVPLGQSAHDEPGSQADEKGGMQGAGAASCLREMDEGGGCRQEQQKGGLDAGKQRALRRGQTVGSL